MPETKTDPAQVFRQFAWHLAGTLAGRPKRPRPAKPAGRR
jgi:hypothetical protein